MIGAGGVAVALVIAGIAGLRTWRIMGSEAPGATYWLLAGLGLIYLAIDEAAALHETLGRELWEAGAPTPPGFNHLDDFFVLLYGVAGVAVSLWYWRELWRSRRILAPFATALAMLATSVAIDGFAPVEGPQVYVEESAEVAGAAFFALAFWRRYRMARAAAVANAATGRAPLAVEAATDS